MKVLSEFEFLIGVPVSTISFVQDYVEIGFDGPIIRLLGAITLLLEKQEVNSVDNTFERSLRRLIGQSYQHGTFEEDCEANLLFSGGYEILVRSTGYEFIHLLPTGKDTVLVW